MCDLWLNQTSQPTLPPRGSHWSTIKLSLLGTCCFLPYHGFPKDNRTSTHGLPNYVCPAPFLNKHQNKRRRPPPQTNQLAAFSTGPSRLRKGTPRLKTAPWAPWAWNSAFPARTSPKLPHPRLFFLCGFVPTKDFHQHGSPPSSPQPKNKNQGGYPEELQKAPQFGVVS